MYKTDDIVIYSSQGVFRIADIEQKKIDDKISDYYVLKPVAGTTSVTYVPCDNDDLLGKMCYALSADEIYDLINNTRYDDLWIENENERRLAFRKMIDQGDCRVLINLLKSFEAHKRPSKGRKMLVMDERLLRDAEKTLLNIFRYAFDIKRSQIMPFINGNLIIQPRTE